MQREGWALVPIGEFPRWAEVWASLNRGVAGDNPILNPDFVAPAIECFASGQETLAVLFREGEPSGAVILSQGIRLGWEVWCPSQLVVAPAIVPGDLGQRELDDLFVRLGPTARRLTFWRQDPFVSSFWESALDPRRICATSYWETISVDTIGSFEDYWGGRAPKFKKELDRRLRRAAAQWGELDFRVLRAPDEVVRAVDRYGELESQGWKGKEGTALHPTNEQGRFYREALRRFAERGCATVFELWGGGTMVAARLCISNADGFFINLKTTYAEEYKKMAPGILLLYESLRALFSDPRVKVCEFYTNADEAKKKWATASRHLITVEAFRGRLLPTLLRMRRSLVPRKPGKTAAAIGASYAGEM
ncbi:GNAT family N-acetyltransferase [Deferrisoma palaeochoriense]